MSESDSSSSSLLSNVYVKPKPKSIRSKPKKISSTKPTPEDDPTWAYQPPEGMALVENAETHDEWDWDTFKKDPELELWVIRVPNGVKPKHLENMTISLPGSSSNQNTKVGVLNRKQESYDVWNVCSSSTSGNGDIGGVEVGRLDEEGTAGGGEEMRGLSCLLPRKKKHGELYIAPTPITRHLLISAQIPKPSSSEDYSMPTQNLPRFSYPQELLKHRFVAFGSTKVAVDYDDEAGSAHGNGGGDDGDVEMEDVLPKSVKAKKSTEKKLSKQTKKRKTAEEAVMPSPKKQKKSKK
ncbi:uncharacterized protein C8R40DRAFT_1166275 [Lentinula edodes]|uniref:uncharacterized protein n=1 Tax=Lentinula edodes TaxID=5353 RepID=UPI001E8E2526|nr:uncharacterized protein C8R40DRAFT_1166275 [Lentinula edodes]KAH7880075.1 hypothetical protein C8R40DRAFT_1166275 [Lentinula edodes]